MTKAVCVCVCVCVGLCVCLGGKDVCFIRRASDGLWPDTWAHMALQNNTTILKQSACWRTGSDGIFLPLSSTSLHSHFVHIWWQQTVPALITFNAGRQKAESLTSSLCPESLLTGLCGPFIGPEQTVFLSRGTFHPNTKYTYEWLIQCNNWIWISPI